MSFPFSLPYAGSCALVQEVRQNCETRGRRVPLFDSHPHSKSHNYFLLWTADLYSVTHRTLKGLMFAEADKPQSANAASLFSSGASLLGREARAPSNHGDFAASQSKGIKYCIAKSILHVVSVRKKQHSTP